MCSALSGSVAHSYHTQSYDHQKQKLKHKAAKRSNLLSPGAHVAMTCSYIFVDVHVSCHGTVV